MIDLALKAGGQDNISIVNVSTIDDDELNMPYTLNDKVKRFIKSLL